MPGGPAPCVDGETRECHQTLREHENILTCAMGSQTCIEGRWQQCQIETLSQQAAPEWYGEASGLRALALSLPADCNPENPCDPSCQQYEEVPDGGLETPNDGGVIVTEWTWEWGSLADFPGGLVKKGVIEPCHTAADCQFNMYCAHPDSGDCNHSICTTGNPLEPGCDDDDASRSCVQKICDIDPTCCSVETEGCSHSMCVTGTKLVSGCGSDAVDAECSKAICDAMPTCCTGSWSAACVAAVNSICEPAGLAECTCQNDEVARTVGGVTSCYYFNNTNHKKWGDANTYCKSTRKLTGLVEIDDSDENDFVRDNLTGESWIGAQSAKPPAGTMAWRLTDGVTLIPYSDWYPPAPSASNNTAAFMKDDNTGDWYSGSSNNTKGFVCEGTPSAYVPIGFPSTNTWSSSCVDLVKEACGAVCDTSTTPDESGTCKPYEPGYVDPDCAGVNLTVAPTCDGMIPVCNHGQTTAPAGLRIVSFQGNSAHFPLSSPDMDPGDIEDTCFTTEEIPPGMCIQVTGCDLDNNGEVVVNPQTSGLTSPTPTPECNVEDNWTLVHPNSECSAPSCGSDDGFQSALTQAGCTMDLPSAEYGDSELVFLTHVYSDNDASTTDTPVDLTYVGGSANCGTSLGWYYDDAASPSEITLCPAACTRVRSNAYVSSNVYLQLGCKTPDDFQEASFLFTYSGECGVDRGVQWSDLGYDATIPSDATIELRFAVAADEGDLPAEDKTDPAWSTPVVIDASSSSCPLNSTCMIDLFQELGGLPDARLPYLAVLVTVIPSSDNQGPVLDDWDIRYSCPFNQ